VTNTFRKAGKWVFGVVGAVLASEGAVYVANAAGKAHYLSHTGNSVAAAGTQAGYELFDRVFGRDKDEPKGNAVANIAAAAIGGAEITALEALVTEGAKSMVNKIPEEARGPKAWVRDQAGWILGAREGLRQASHEGILSKDDFGAAAAPVNALLRGLLSAGSGIAGAEAGRPVQALFRTLQRVGIG
jgi:type IV secretory pathway VirB2 component (pilin)